MVRQCKTSKDTKGLFFATINHIIILLWYVHAHWMMSRYDRDDMGDSMFFFKCDYSLKISRHSCRFNQLQHGVATGFSSRRASSLQVVRSRRSSRMSKNRRSKRLLTVTAKRWSGWSGILSSKLAEHDITISPFRMCTSSINGHVQ